MYQGTPPRNQPIMNLAIQTKRNKYHNIQLKNQNSNNYNRRRERKLTKAIPHQVHNREVDVLSMACQEQHKLPQHKNKLSKYAFH